MTPRLMAQLRTVVCALAATLAIVVASPLGGQGVRPKTVKTPLGGVGTTNNGPPSQDPDLYPSQIDITADRYVKFNLVNNGLTAVTTPFVADIYIDGVRRDTYKVPAIGAQATVPITSTLAQAEQCSRLALRIVVDAQHVVSEHSEDNNDVTRTFYPPCPDLVVAEMKQDWEQLNTKYRVQITVRNAGSATMLRATRNRVLYGSDLLGTPTQDQADLPLLAPGQSYTFHLKGTWLASSTVTVAIWLDSDYVVAESNEANNKAQKTFGPH